MPVKTYNPRDMLLREFDPDQVFYDGSSGVMARPMMTDPDLLQISNFYRETIVSGSVLSLGCGPMLYHYMSVVADRISRLTGLDISRLNLEAIRELAAAIDGQPTFEHLRHVDFVRLACFSDWARLHFNLGDSQEWALQRLLGTNQRGGVLDLIHGNMFDLDALVGERKFNNVIFGFSVFAGNEGQVVQLFQAAKRHLATPGRLIIIDFQGFSADDVDDGFEEDDAVTEACPNPMDFDLELLRRCLVSAGFSAFDVTGEEAKPELKGEEAERGFTYLMLTARN